MTGCVILIVVVIKSDGAPGVMLRYYWWYTETIQRACMLCSVKWTKLSIHYSLSHHDIPCYHRYMQSQQPEQAGLHWLLPNNTPKLVAIGAVRVHAVAAVH